MEVRYSKSMEKKLKNVQKSFGSMSKKVQLLISILRVAENLEEVPTSPPARRHKLQNLALCNRDRGGDFHRGLPLKEDRTWML